MANIAFLGTGLLGGALAEAAAKRGDSVTAWNRTPDKARALSRFGVQAASTPAEAVRGASRVHLVLRDDAVVEEVVAAARPGLSADAVLIDHTTTQPALTAKRARRLRAEGVKYLHCPVFMGPAAARDAQGSMMAAGPRELFDRVQADLARMTGRLEYLGERADLAAVNKLFGNAMIVGIVAITADVLAMARASGVDPGDAIARLKLLDLNAMVARRGVSMAKGDFAASFELAMARKDVGLMLETIGDGPDGGAARDRRPDGRAHRRRARREGRQRAGDRRRAHGLISRPSGTSSTSSLCTCMTSLVASFSDSSQPCTAIVASSMRSAAVPCTMRSPPTSEPGDTLRGFLPEVLSSRPASSCSTCKASPPPGSASHRPPVRKAGPRDPFLQGLPENLRLTARPSCHQAL